MRSAFSVIFLALIAALAVCAITAKRSRKAIGGSVSFLVASLIPPVIGNLIIIASSSGVISTVGSYIYFLGMDLVMFALLRFTFDYCRISWPSEKLKTLVYFFLIFDAGQLLCNPLLGHAFDMESVLVDGLAYYRLVPRMGQAFHRVVDYSIFGAVLIIFFVKMIRSPRIYSERYSVIFTAMIVGGLWQTFYIFSRTPVDSSMIGFAVFGLLVFFFALYYRPLRLLDRMLAQIASEMKEALFFFDVNGRCIWANALGLEFAGIGDEDYEQAADRLRQIVGAYDQAGEDWTGPKVHEAKNTGKYYALEKHALMDGKGRAVGSFLSVRDNTDEQVALRREKYSATHDSLTGLYNREYLYERVRETLQSHPGEEYLVVFADVKDFKIVNDIFGNAFGDYTLTKIGEWIRSSMSDRCVYGRFAGDMFGICMPIYEFNPQRIEEQLSGFVVSNGSVEHHVLIHMGVYEVTEPGVDISVMFDRAHMALSTIKDEYQTHIAYYDDEMRSKVLWTQHITSQLPEALRQRQIVPYLQPLVDRMGQVIGAEALVRWNHPVDGFLSPKAFIPIFEKNGMIAEVDRYMWRCACEILARWKKDHGDLFISINISPKDFYFMDVAAELKDIVRRYGVSPSRLRVEITETVMMTDVENRMRILAELKQAGFIVEMDDFGSGYSSLNMLKDMPVDVLKIDMKFLNKSSNDAKAQTILHNIIHLSDDLGISSLTEGVETQSQYKMLTDMGCKLFQGYYFAKPMPVEEFERVCFSMSRPSRMA